MIIKITFSVLLIILCGWIGNIFSMRLREKYRLITDLMTIAELISTDISFGQVRLHQTLSKIKQICGTKLQIIIDNYLALIENYEEITVEKVKKCLPEKVLDDQESDLVMQLLYTLGKSDSDTQIKNLEHFKKSLELSKITSYDRQKKFAGLYVKLGALVGLAIAIMVW